MGERNREKRGRSRKKIEKENRERKREREREQNVLSILIRWTISYTQLIYCYQGIERERGEKESERGGGSEGEEVREKKREEDIPTGR